MDWKQAAALCGMDSALCTLAELYCRQDAPEEEIAAWFAGIRFEALRPEASGMAAAMAASRNYAGVPAALIPRLRGIIKYVHTLNAGMTAGLYSLGGLLRDAGIPMVLLGGTAVHFGCPQAPVRHLWRMQLGVSEGDFRRVEELAAKAGFTVEATPWCVTARKENTQCVAIVRGAEGAGALTTGGISFRMPSQAELLTGMADTLFQFFLDKSPGAKLLPWIMDLRCVLSWISDWEQTAALCAKQGQAARVRFMLQWYAGISGQELPQSLLDLFGTDRETRRLERLLGSCRRCGDKGHRWKRLWLSARIRCPENSLSAAKIFVSALKRAIKRRISRLCGSQDQQPGASARTR